MATAQTKIGFLNSWKEIASYLDKSVRTVQRMEKIGLPVRRLSPGARASVVADVRDIDAWVRSAHAHGFAFPESSRQLIFRGALFDSVQTARLLRAELMLLRESQKSGLAQLAANIARLEKTCFALQHRSQPHELVLRAPTRSRAGKVSLRAPKALPSSFEVRL
jgi:hypothetical protein